MKILIVGQYFWPENFRINEVADSLSRAGCEITVLTGPPNYPDGKVFQGYSALLVKPERWGTVRIYRVPQVPRGRASAIRLAANYVSFVLSASLFGPWLLRRKHFDVILVYAPGPITQAIPALWIAFLKRIPTVTWVQDLWPESLEATQFVKNRSVLKLVEWMVRWIYRHNAALLVQSRAFVEPVRRLAGGTPVWYHPNPGELLSNHEGTRGTSVQFKDAFNVVFAGNLGTVQALDTLIAAAELTKDERDLWWIFVGSGSRAQWMAEQISARGLKQVVMTGRLQPEEMPGIFAQSSALLVSLVRDPTMSKTIPSKIQAYLAAGKPIVAALDGEGAMVVAEARAGVACPAEDAAALANVVLQMKSLSSEQLEAMGIAGKRYYDAHFHPKVLTRRLLVLLSDVVARRSSRAIS